MIYGGLFDTLEICCDHDLLEFTRMAEVVQKFSSLCPKIYAIFRYLGIRNKHKISESHVGERKINRVGHLWNT